MISLKELIRKVDVFQQRHRYLAFPYAVVKKYGDDSAGQQAALLTYYAFLSLFPLLLVLTTVTGMIVGSNSSLEKAIIGGVTDYFPLLGNQLSSQVNGLHSSGLALVVGVLFILYGARGVADAFRNSVQHIWNIPKKQRGGFPKTVFKSFVIIIVGGLGLVLASLTAGLVGAFGQGLALRVVAVGLNMFVLFWLFTFLINFCLPRHVKIKEIWVGAATAAVLLVVLQALGGYVLAHELKNLNALYSYFAVALGLLFWIYLQAQALCYAMEISVVSSQRLWPRSLNAATPTPVDKKLSKS